MFCRKCGAPTEGDQTLCSNCAAEQAAVPCEETPVQVEEAVEVTETVCDTFELNTADAVPAKKPSKKKGGLIAAIVAVVLVAAAAVAVVLNLDSIGAFVDRTFQKPEEYLMDVESDAIAEYSAELSQSYGQMLQNYKKDPAANNGVAADAEIRFILGDEVLSVAEATLKQQGIEMDLGWLNDLKLSVNTNIQDSAMQVGMGLGVGKNDVVSADVIYDTENGGTYVAFPELNEDYLYVDMSSQIDMEAFTTMYADVQKMSADLAKELPSEAEMNDLINKYAKIVLSNVKDVEKETQTITIDGVSQKVVVLTAKITQEDLLEIVEQVLEEAEKDKTLEKILAAYSKYVNAVGELSGGEYYEPVDLYQQFADSIPYALESIEAAKEDTDNGNYLKLKAYVDMKNNVRGHALDVYSDGEKTIDTISWLTVQKGDVTYTEAELGPVEITGEKTEKKGVSEGTYTLTVDGKEIGAVEFENMTETSGTLRIIPSEEAISAALAGSGIPATMGEDLALQISYTEESFEIVALADAKTLIGLVMTAKVSDSGKITIPTDAVDVNDQYALMDWLEGADFNKILENMENANIPQELVDALSNAMSGAMYY